MSRMMGLLPDASHSDTYPDPRSCLVGRDIEGFPLIGFRPCPSALSICQVRRTWCEPGSCNVLKKSSAKSSSEAEILQLGLAAWWCGFLKDGLTAKSFQHPSRGCLHASLLSISRILNNCAIDVQLLAGFQTASPELRKAYSRTSDFGML